MDMRTIAVKWSFDGEPEFFGPHTETGQDAVDKAIVVCRKHWPKAFVSGQWTPVDPRSSLIPDKWKDRRILCEYCAIREEPGVKDFLIGYLIRPSLQVI